MKDYRERTIVRKNKPRSSGGARFVALFVLCAVIFYGFGLGSGWYLFRYRVKPQAAAFQSANPQASVLGRQTSAAHAVPGTAQPSPTAGGHPELPLTFYETLPKGAKVPLGSGINPVPKGASVSANPAPSAVPAQPQQKPEQQKPAAAAAAPSSQPQAVIPATKPVAKSAANAAAKPEPAPQKKFAVQVASCQTRKEAEEMKVKLAAKGQQAYVVETAIPGKGTWYRVRVGKGLDAAKAKELAGKLGSAALTIPE
ncbi:MAG: SPOR domain-containing protein [Geobacter sp.]|nr:SPOR domain-containing protein [Geobacter sp.]